MNDLRTHSITLVDRHDVDLEVRAEFFANEVAIACVGLSRGAGDGRELIGAMLDRENAKKLRDELSKWLEP